MVSVADTEWINPERGAHQSSDAQLDCKICSDIKTLLYSDEPEQYYLELPLGIAEDLLQSQCSHVAMFRDWLHDRITVDPACAKCHLDIKEDPVERRCIHFLLRHRFHSDVDTAHLRLLFTRGSHGVSPQCMGLLRKLTVPGHPGRMRAVDPRWIDVDLLKHWTESCDATHGVRCRQSSWLQQSEAVKPKYLVDTLEMCVVEGDRAAAEYVALSYQWGQTKTLRNTIEVRERLLRPFSLSDRELACFIPQTISDAFAVVKVLGYRYLWVDALCVTQDDYVEFATELRRMHRIYNSASFTIVAADGSDASHGLRGLKGLTAARNHSQVPIQLSGSEQVVEKHPSQRYMKSRDQGAYHTRAWTFQEFQFSLRRLVFQDDAVEWHCQNGRWREDLIREIPGLDRSAYVMLYSRSTVYQELANALPTTGTLVPLIMSFNERNLSFPEDALPAFAGIQSLLEQIYQPGFLYGLPEFWFELALWWTPFKNLERRVASNPRPSTERSYQLPSWSWIGWAGGIHLPGNETLGHAGDDFIEPVTKWYTLVHPVSADRRPIKSAWHEYRSRFIEGHSTTLPEGWKQYADDKHGYVFRHTRGGNCLYPFPVPEPSSASVSMSVPQTAYLAAKTSRAFFFGKHVYINPLHRLGQHPLWLRSSQDQYAGLLHLHNAEEESFFKHEDGDSSSKRQLELVAICKGTSKALLSPELDWDVETLRRCDTGNFDDRNKIGNGPPADCMFVLWIEWEDGVAYRRACGTVTAEAWEQEREKELVDLILG